YCWKMTPRSGLGPSTSRPSTNAAPPVGSSRPARMFIRVDFPQPEGPTTVMNSFSSTFRLTSPSASKRSLPSTNVLLMFWTWILWSLLPRGQLRLDHQQGAVHEQTENADHEDTDEDGGQVVVDLGLLHAISESLLGCDQLGRYHGCPGGAEADAHPDQDERCRSRD